MPRLVTPKPEIALLGLNHRSAGLDIREKLAVQAQELPDALRWLSASVDEAVLLSTCHRTELYVAMHRSTPSRAFLEDQMGRLRRVARDDFAAHTYFLAGRSAVDHLFRVACGLDSVVVGESQILGQVRDALAEAREARSIGPTLEELFTAALRVGRRARRSTGINRTAASLSSAAVELARQVVDLESGHLVLVGAGKMGELAAKSLLKKGVGRFSVVARTLERAQRLTLRCGDALGIERLEEAIEGADAVITATNAPHPIVTAQMVAEIMRRRSRPLWFIDIAVPRDVEAAVGEVPGVTLYDVDDLQEVAAAGLAARQAEVPTVLRLAQEEANRFQDWYRLREAGAAVVALREHFDKLRREELARRRNRLQGLTPRQLQAVEALTVSILNKVLHHPTTALRRMATNGQSTVVPHLLAEFFGVPGGPLPEGTTAANPPASLTNDTGGQSSEHRDSTPRTPNDTREMCGEANAHQPKKGEDEDRMWPPGRRGP